MLVDIFRVEETRKGIYFLGKNFFSQFFKLFKRAEKVIFPFKLNSKMLIHQNKKFANFPRGRDDVVQQVFLATDESDHHVDEGAYSFGKKRRRKNNFFFFSLILYSFEGSKAL